MKNSALEKIEREYAKSRCQRTINQEQKEDLIFNCVMEKNNNEAINELKSYLIPATY